MKKINLNRLITNQSSELFQLDDLALFLLGSISSKGANTIYGLTKLAREHNQEAKARSRPVVNASHATITRRVQELLATDYLYTAKEEAYRIPGQKKKYYDVTSKGFLASLANVNIDQTYRFAHVYESTSMMVGNAELTKTTMLFYKACLSTWFQWHVFNGLLLSKLADARLYRTLALVPTISYLEKTREASDRGAVLGISPDILATDFNEKDLLFSVMEMTKENSPILAKLIVLRLAIGLKLIAMLSQESRLEGKRVPTLVLAGLIASHTDTIGEPILVPTQLDDTMRHELEQRFSAFTETYGGKIGENVTSFDRFLTVIREHIIESDWLMWHKLPEKEIIEIYDSNLERMLE